MITIKDLIKTEIPAEVVDDPPIPKVTIRYFVTLEDERFFKTILVDDFDIENTSEAAVKTMIENNANTGDILVDYQRRKEQASDTYKQDGSGFKRNLKFVDWDTEGLNTSYEIGDVVTYNGTIYRCIQAHTVSDIT